MQQLEIDIIIKLSILFDIISVNNKDNFLTNNYFLRDRPQPFDEYSEPHLKHNCCTSIKNIATPCMAGELAIAS